MAVEDDWHTWKLNALQDAQDHRERHGDHFRFPDPRCSYCCNERDRRVAAFVLLAEHDDGGSE